MNFHLYSTINATRFFLLLFLISACSSVGVTKVEIKSNPPAAQVLSLERKVVGVTPLVLTGDILKQNSKEGRVFVILSAPGYVERELFLDVHGDDVHQVTLAKLDENYFIDKILGSLSPEANHMARDLLQIQALLLSKKINEAETGILEFQKRFPNIASSFVLLAGVEMARGNVPKARGYLLRAQSLDPSDPVAARLLASDQKGAIGQ